MRKIEKLFFQQKGEANLLYIWNMTKTVDNGYIKAEFYKGALVNSLISMQ